MSKSSDPRLWRVSFSNRNGYSAPARYVEAKSYKEAHRLVRDEKFRLLDFSDEWSFQLSSLDHLEKINGKWIQKES